MPTTPATTTKSSAAKAGLSPVAGASALGGLLLIAGFFAPLFNDAQGTEDSPVGEILRDFNTRLGQARDAKESLPPEYVKSIDSAAEHATALLATPSPKNLAWLSADGIDLLTIAEFQNPSLKQELGGPKVALRGLLIVLLAMPIVGTYQVIRGIHTRFKKPGTLGLLLCFFAGFFYAGIGTVAITSVPVRAQNLIGPASWLLTAGGGLLLFTAIFGVSRTTWWRAYALYIVGFAALIAAAYVLTSELH
ncbi:MAG TPA: hypothetical protein ENJ18_16185 [Nannocystis exedens]|nr:hypothetical protein [Nannocystis exedens]